MRKLYFAFIAGAALLLFPALSEGDENAITLVPTGFASLREGQVVKGEPEQAHPEARVDHVWVQEMDIGMNVQAKFSNLPLTGNLGMEMKVCNDNVEYGGDLGQTRRLNFYPYLSRADLTYIKGDKEAPRLVIEAGYFPFKYNNLSRNLGEYLFRSGTYPQYLITNFDFPLARLLGVRVGGTVFDKITWDVLATTNVEWTAIGDLNLSGLLSWKPAPLFEMGLGASWCSIASVNMDNTSPKSEANTYVVDNLRYYYTFAGQKLMARFALDLQQLFPGNNIFGKQDLKLYSEAAVLGLINYPKSYDGYTQYDTLWQRIPVMVGFNVPTCKVLDVLSAEAEWFGNPYPNDISQIMFDNTPTALSSYGNQKSGTTYLNNHGDDWKWSVYGKKTFSNHLDVTFQAARDHVFWYHLDYTKLEGKEALRMNNDWYYTIKFGYTF